MAEQRVTDEQLTEWDAYLTERPDHLATASLVLALIADLRASRAREAEAYSVDFEQCRRGAVAAEAERDALQQRVEQQRADLEAAFEQLHNAEQRITDALRLCTQGPDGDIKLPFSQLLDAIIAELTGTEPE